MSNSLTNHYLIQLPDYHPFAVITAGCISGCISGISPVLELGHRVSVDKNIVQQLKVLFCKAFDALTYLFCKHNWRLGVSSPVNRLGGLTGSPHAEKADG